ncbi:MAG: hypothetical protein OFPI_24350 [Osedax symbiont Rs2]|nr:MAG: hypothetical protein OFPI_24350 [Osedax symbiont Rs2]
MFIAHGEYQVFKRDQLCIIESRGPFNAEMVCKYSLEVDQVTQQMPETWGQIVIMHQDSLFTPQAEIEMSNAIIARRERGLLVSAVIISNSQVHMNIVAQVSNIYERAGISYAFFDDTGGAEQWALQQLSAHSESTTALYNFQKTLVV